MSKQRHEPFGRPTKYCPELVDLICDIVATTPHGINLICAKHPELPAPITIATWRAKYPDFSTRYMEARKLQSHLLFESAIDDIEELKNYTYEDPKSGATCIDAGIVAMQKALANQKTHQAARIHPKEYGNQAESNESIDKSQLKEIAERVAQMNKESEKEY